MKEHNPHILSIAPAYFHQFFESSRAAQEERADHNTTRTLMVASIMDGSAPALHTYDGTTTANGLVAVHYLKGMVRYSSYWWHSTQELIEDIKSADQDDKIIAHVIFCSSPGGEVFGCHEAHLAIRNCTKPVIAFCDEMMASAAYWICSAATKVYASSPYSEVGSIGVMARMLDDSGWIQQNGFKEIILYADGSDLKNKVVQDALDGKSRDYIEKVLNPLYDAITGDVSAARKEISKTPEALRGEIYYAFNAPAGLIDGIKSFNECVEEAYALGLETENSKLIINNTL